MPSGSFGVSNNSQGLNTWIDWWTADDPGNNGTRVYVKLRARRNSSTTYGNGSWTLYVDGAGQTTSGTRSIGTGDTDIAEHNWYIGHDGNGYKAVDISVSGGMPGTSWTSTSGGQRVELTNYDRRPAQPYNLSIANGSVSVNSFGVNYTRNPNGTSINRDHAEWSRADNGQVVWNDYGPGGYTSPNGGQTPGAPALAPGTTYRVRVRSESPDGWGDFSGYITQTTIPADPPGITAVPAVSGTSTRVTLSAPGGVSGVDAWLYRYRPVGGATSTIEHNGYILDILGLTPGRSYEFSGAVRIGGYTSPWSAWKLVAQPSPNTSAGDYFDGNTAATVDTAYSWDGAQFNSPSRQSGYAPVGWLNFAAGAAASGGTGAVARASGGRDGRKVARVSFFDPTVAAGFIAGTDAVGAGAVEPGATYWGSIYAQMYANPRSVEAGLAWHREDGSIIGYTWGPDHINLPRGGFWTRVIARGVAPEGAAKASVVMRDRNFAAHPYGQGPYGQGAYGGSGETPWTPFVGGDYLLLDQAALNLSTLFPYFDGSTPDTALQRYDWLGEPDASPSSRTQLEQVFIDLLADPDCPPAPTPPTPPSIPSSCIDEVGVWRRYWAVIPAEEISEWMDVLPTLYITTNAAAARQVRIRVYANPTGAGPETFDATEWDSEQILSYVPPQTTITLDGTRERATARVNGRDPVDAGRLLYGSNGTPPTWPVLSCGTGYLLSFDVPLDAPVGNETIAIDLTQRQ